MVKLINGYGITETTVYSSFKTIEEQDIRERTGSIGRPLPGTYFYVLGPDMVLCPIGVVGELYIGGLGVGRGYLGRPELTSSRFIDDPLRPGQVLYRSGDLVRWLANGEVEYICRADTQVKVRGYRVEIAEIEAALTARAAIGESVVLAETQGDTTQLIGFFTSTRQEDLAQLRSHLEQHLPNYMVPARLVQVERIPVTPNGKVDRVALLAARTPASPGLKQSAASELEATIAKSWANVLGVPADDLGASDSFFAVGGDSIGANLVVRMLVSQGLEIELLDLFENPTIGGLAEVLLGKRRAGPSQPAEAERAAYWHEVAAAKVGPLFGPGERDAGAEGRHIVTVNIQLGDVRPALTGSAHEPAVRDALLTALGVSLRMSGGPGKFRVAVLDRPAEGPLRVAPAVLTIEDINLGRENLAAVHDQLARAMAHAWTWDEASAELSGRAALADAVVIRDADQGVEASEALLGRLADGCLLVDCRVVRSTVVVGFTAPARTAGAERLQLLAQAFKFALRDTLHALPTAAAPSRPAQLGLDVQPFNDVFFKDCTHQALLAAVRHFGRDVRPLLANAAAVCEPDVGRTAGLRVRVRYLDRRPLTDVLADLGIEVRRASRSSDVCEELVECLSQGSLGVVKLDCYFVEKQPELFRKKHGEHTVLVCGYDRDRRAFEIVDNEAARAVQYRRSTIGFDELRAGYQGYQELFNPRALETSLLTVADDPGRSQRGGDDGALRREVLATLGLAHGRRDEERAALALLDDDLRALLAGEAAPLESVEQFSFTFGELLLARRLQRYQLAHILGERALTELLDAIVGRIETVQNLLLRWKMSGACSPARMQSMRSLLAEARQQELAYAEAFARVSGAG